MKLLINVVFVALTLVIGGAHSTDSLTAQACQPGTYACDRGNIAVCNGQGNWQLSAQCGHEYACKIHENGMAYCDPREPDEPPPVVEATHANVAPRQDPRHCQNRGEYRCDADKNDLLVCNAQHTWQLSARCGGPNCCKDSAHGSYCDCRPGTGESSQESDNITPRQDPRYCQDPGEYRCDADKDDLLVCDAQHTWQLSARCGGANCCKDSAHGSYCDCRPGTGDVETIPQSKEPDAAISQRSSLESRGASCPEPNMRSCDASGSGDIFICNYRKEWAFYARCGPDCCVGWGIGNAECNCDRTLSAGHFRPLISSCSGGNSTQLHLVYGTNSTSNATLPATTVVSVPKAEPTETAV